MALIKCQKTYDLLMNLIFFYRWAYQEAKKKVKTPMWPSLSERPPEASFSRLFYFWPFAAVVVDVVENWQQVARLGSQIQSLIPPLQTKEAWRTCLGAWLDSMTQIKSSWQAPLNTVKPTSWNLIITKVKCISKMYVEVFWWDLFKGNQRIPILTSFLLRL